MANLNASTLRWAYVVALSIIALFTILSDQLLRGVSRQQEGMASIINESGRQRMRSQRIASLLAQKAIGTENVDARLKRAIDEFQTVHVQLISNFNDADLDADAAAYLNALYFSQPIELDRIAKEFISTARELATAPDFPSGHKAKLDSLFATANTTLLMGLDRVVIAYQLNSDKRIQEFNRDQTIVTLVTLLILLLEALFIYRPMMERILASFEAIFENAAVGVATVSRSGRMLQLNAKMADICKMSKADLEQKKLTDVGFDDGLPIEASATATTDSQLFARLSSGEVASFSAERRLVRDGQAPIWCEMTVSLLRDRSSRPDRFIYITRDITEQKQLEANRNILLGELNHRVKNTLAVIQGIVFQMLETTPDPKTFSKVLMARIQSLSRAHDQLNQSAWSPLGLHQLIDLETVGPFAAYADRIQIEGIDVSMPAQASLTLHLVIHELLTNAIKYGAWSNETGRILVTTAVRHDGDQQTVDIDWIETGGPPPKQSQETGFGSMLINRGISFSLNGTAKMTFEQQGLRVKISFPLPRERETRTLEIANWTGEVARVSYKLA